jgi:HSP20 family protein
MNTATLIPWRWKTDEDKSFGPLHQAMNELFNSFNVPQGTEFPLRPYYYGTNRSWMPRLDISETDKEVFVMVELPGLEEKDVNVSLSGDQLIISGEKHEERDEKNRTYHRIERNWGSFQRSLPLYWEVDRNNVKAIFSKGVLTVTLTKTLKAQEMIRKIPVKSI